jgi:hypothetical protein
MSYSWTPSQDPAFFPGRQAVVQAGNEHVGAFGIIHPEVGADGLHRLSAGSLSVAFCLACQKLSLDVQASNGICSRSFLPLLRSIWA